MKDIKAVIFDLDGLLVDSEPRHFEADKILFGRYGRRYTLALQKEFTGIRVVDSIVKLKKRWHLTPSVKELLKERQEIFRYLVETKLRLNRGVLPILRFLKKKKFPLGLGTSAEKWCLAAVLNKFKIRNYFAATINGEQVRRGKPHPETYLELAKKLKVDPSACLVLEDAINGVTAAKVAGMTCFAIPGPYTQDLDYFQADQVFSSLLGVRTYLKKHIK